MSTATKAQSPALVQPCQPGIKSAAARGKMARGKGQSGEREVAAIICALTGYDVRRAVRQHKGDSDLEGLPGWSVEVKRHASTPRAKLAEWWAQTVRQAHDAKALPVLFYRADRADWRCVWAADLHLDPKAQTIRPGYEHTLDALPAAWWLLGGGLALCCPAA